MQGKDGKLVARCVVCRGDIHHGEQYEIWENGYYCRRHSLAYLRERARIYAASLTTRSGKENR
jgi:hypothetical protein